MNITDELRKWARQFRRVWVDPHSGDLTYITNEHACPPSLDAMRLEDYIDAIADRIDAEHDQMHDFCERLESAATDREDVTLWGVDYTALPIDADGEPVHIGDVMEWPTTGETFEVVGIGDGTLFYIEDGGELADWTGASTKRHHAPTVEDVLREFAVRVAGDECVTMRTDVIAEFAKRLQLKVVDA